MATFNGVSVRGWQFIGIGAPSENLVVLFDTTPIASQVYRKKGTMVAYVKPSWVPEELSGIYVEHVSLYFGASSILVPRIAPDCSPILFCNWAVDGVPYSIMTGFAG